MVDEKQLTHYHPVTRMKYRYRPISGIYQFKVNSFFDGEIWKNSGMKRGFLIIDEIVNDVIVFNKSQEDRLLELCKPYIDKMFKNVVKSLEADYEKHIKGRH